MQAMRDTPTLTIAQLAVMTGAHPNTIKVITGTDEFRATLAEAIQQKYNAQLAGVRSASLDNAMQAFGSLNRILGEDSMAPTAQQIEAAKLSLEFTQKTALAAVSAATPAQGVPGQSLTVNVALTAGDLSRAREKAASRARELTVDATPALPAPEASRAIRIFDGGSSL
jgi:hypothetical protein